METGPLTKVKAETAAQLCAPFKLSEEAEPLLTETATPAAFLASLLEKKLYPDALKLLAHGLPKREAAWWACLCARDNLPETPKPKELAALEAAEAWVFKPSDEKRREALAKAEAANLAGSPSALAAAAAGWSGGSLAPAGADAVPPGDNMTPAAVFSAVMMAAFQGDPAGQAARFEGMIGQGIDIANGGTGRPKG
ncbi:MAG: hypothetical protein GVY13_12870 [Alphaproteobacteria bacterium]|jgi:hypothetical protein|nr:hypothetical protein [Alphaproteobacteria bacterium]